MPTPGRTRTEPGPPRAVGLDLLRALAATGVVVTHVAFATGVVNPDRVASSVRLVLPRLDVGVSIFFVLSGLLVTRPFIRSLLEGAPPPATRGYLRRRAARIYPVYWFALAATAVLSARALPLSELVPAALLVHVYRPSTAIGPITQSWSLAAEIAFYLLVPLWFRACTRWVARRVGEGSGEGTSDRRDAVLSVLRWGFASWFLVSLVWRLGVIATTDTFDLSDPSAVDVRGALLSWLPNHLDTFAVGALLAVQLEAGRARPLRLPLRLACYAVAAAALWVTSVHLDLPPLFTGFDGPQTLARHWLLLLCASALVIPSVPALAGLHRRAADSLARPARTMLAAVVTSVRGAALASYGVYLWHQLVTTEWFSRLELPEFRTAFPTTLLAVMAISTALAAVTYWLVERPAMDLWAPTRSPLRAAPAVRSLGQARQLDGLRGVAVLAVLATHIVFLADGDRSASLRGGFLGVDVFLVLSGFLIGGSLLREVHDTGRIDGVSFTARRARRLVPALVVFLVIQGAVALALDSDLRTQLEQALFALSFTGNWQLSWGIHPPYELVHLWSLALEVQFYLLLALLVWFLHRRRPGPRTVVSALALGAAVVALWRLWLHTRGVEVGALYERTDARLDSMLIGLAAAYLWRSRLLGRRGTTWLGLAGAAVLGVAMVVAEPEARWLFEGGFTVVALATAAMVVVTAEGHGPLGRFADLAPLRWFGLISYSLYLWHLPVYLWVVRALDTAPLAARVAIAVPASILLAWLSFQLVERWTLAPWRRRLERRAVGSPG